MGGLDVALEASSGKKRKPRRNKRAPESDALSPKKIAPLAFALHTNIGEVEDGAQIDDNKPAMAEKLASLDLVKNDNDVIQELGNGKMGRLDVALEASSEKKRKSRRKRRVPEYDALSSEKIAPHDIGECADGTHFDNNEPAMTDKLASLDLVKNDSDGIKELGNCKMGHLDVPLEASMVKSSKKKPRRKKRAHESDAPFPEKIASHDIGEGADGIQIDDDEPTMTDKLASLDLVKNDSDEIQELGNCKMGRRDVVLEASSGKKRKPRRKRRASESDALSPEKIAPHDGADETQIDDDNEPTMADKLASLDLVKHESDGIQERQDSLLKQPPSADSVHVLLKQALHADDRALLLDCLYNQDDKVIANSVLLLNPADVFKLLDSLISIIHSRGAVLVCVLPWLRSLLLQHSTRIMSQESSLLALSSLYQLTESRVATLKPGLQLASSLDFLFAGVDDDGNDEYDSVPPVIYEDKDDSEEEESEEDAMDTDQESKEPEEFSGISDIDGNEDISV